ncbi:MAG: hypothetical protein V4719_20095 [Planctomycetota bacterium]
MVSSSSSSSRYGSGNRRSAGDRIEEVGRVWFQPWWLAGIALACGAIILAPRVVKSLPEIGNRPEYQLRVDDIQVTEIPQWVPRDLVAQVAAQAGMNPTRSVLDERLTSDLANAFRQNPWVDKVIKVSKTVPARVTIELVYRRPVAMVEVSTGMLPVDGFGVLLPPTAFTPEDALRYPLITQPKSSPVGAVGKPWGDAQVIAAARLAAVLLPHWQDFRLSAIEIPTAVDLRAPLEELVFQLQTQGGSRIVWGRAPGVIYPLELSADQKIGRLEECLTRFGGFDQPDGPYEIDIRHFQEITRVRLTATKELRRKL